MAMEELPGGAGRAAGGAGQAGERMKGALWRRQPGGEPDGGEAKCA